MHYFCSSGTATSPPHPYGDFRFKTYAPVAFKYFRDLFQIKFEDFLVRRAHVTQRLDVYLL